MSTAALPPRNRFSLILQLATSKPSDPGPNSPSTPTGSTYAPVSAIKPSSLSPGKPEFRNPFAPDTHTKAAPAFTSFSPAEVDPSENISFFQKARRMSKILTGDTGSERQGGVASKLVRKLSFNPSLAPSSPSQENLTSRTGRPSRSTNANGGTTRSASSPARTTVTDRSTRPSLDRSVRSFSSVTYEGTVSSHSPIPPVPPLTPRPSDKPTAIETVPIPPHSSHSLDLPARSPSALLTPRPSSASGRRLVKEKRKRKSEEGGSRSSSVSSTGRRLDTRSTPSLRRANSMWAEREKARSNQGAIEPLPDRATAIKNLKEGPFSDQDPDAERKRVLNVKRARKMRELFGDEPPPELYQLPSTAEIPEPIDLPSRSSAALLSLPPLDMLPTQPSSPRKATHRPHSSMSSIYSQPSAIMVDPEPLDTSQTSSARPPPTPPPFAAYMAQSPPPFTDVAPTETRVDPENSFDFRQRRLRAAKLARFFGVTYQDISSFDQPGVFSPRPSVNTTVAVTYEPPTSPTDVDVRIAENNRFWPKMERRDTMREPADMGAVINKLRTMR